MQGSMVEEWVHRNRGRDDEGGILTEDQWELDTETRELDSTMQLECIE